MTIELHSLKIGSAAVARRSTRREPWQLVRAREVTADDLAAVHSTIIDPPANPKAPLARIRDAHHYIAKLVSEEKNPIEISAITGYSVSRIRTLTTDPTFCELVSFYTEQRVHRDLDIDMSIRHVAMAATAILQERLDDEPEAFSNEELRKLRNDSLDRIGRGPTSKRSIELNDPRGILNELRSLAIGESNARIIPRDTIEGDYTEVLDGEESPSSEEAANG